MFIFTFHVFSEYLLKNALLTQPEKCFSLVSLEHEHLHSELGRFVARSFQVKSQNLARESLSWKQKVCVHAWGVAGIGTFSTKEAAHWLRYNLYIL